MSIDLRYPNIQGKTEAEQLVQVKSYLHQLVEQLNWSLNTINSYQGGNTSAPLVYRGGANGETTQNAEDVFNSIKALIIKSADIVKAYETTIFSDFNGMYFADSSFGAYIDLTKRTVEENSKGVKENYSRVEAIDGRVDGVEDEIRTTNAYIHRGLLENGKYGIEVGETTENGAFLKYARFTADRLSFFDANDTEVAYIGAGCLYVNGKTVFLGEIQLGNYITDTTDGLAFTWVG